MNASVIQDRIERLVDAIRTLEREKPVHTVGMRITLDDMDRRRVTFQNYAPKLQAINHKQDCLSQEIAYLRRILNQGQ